MCLRESALPQDVMLQAIIKHFLKITSLTSIGIIEATVIEGRTRMSNYIRTSIYAKAYLCSNLGYTVSKKWAPNESKA